jgi:hypothetical protein
MHRRGGPRLQPAGLPAHECIARVHRRRTPHGGDGRPPSRRTHPKAEIDLAIASNGRMTNLKGGLPILVDGQAVGGIGPGEQDRRIAAAALAAGFGAASGCRQ